MLVKVVPEPKLAELMPRGLETLGVVVVELVVEVLEVAVPEELVSGGPHGFGSGSRFSVLEGWPPELSAFPPKAEKGLFPNCTKRGGGKHDMRHLFSPDKYRAIAFSQPNQAPIDFTNYQTEFWFTPPPPKK